MWAKHDIGITRQDVRGVVRATNIVAAAAGGGQVFDIPNAPGLAATVVETFCKSRIAQACVVLATSCTGTAMPGHSPSGSLSTDQAQCHLLLPCLGLDCAVCAKLIPAADHRHAWPVTRLAKLRSDLPELGMSADPVEDLWSCASSQEPPSLPGQRGTKKRKALPSACWRLQHGDAPSLASLDGICCHLTLRRHRWKREVERVLAKS
mmetsp:Transcript_37852/g.87636  ORF Transcript_37852/g.87636 Transcript_37852/m.87636 type:complete len:207 (+) Transcript_37852:222-842(+)